MKKLIAPALLAVLALTGCSAAATPAPPSTPNPMIKLSEAQKTALMTDLAKVNPRLDGQRVVVTATQTCRSILKGEPEEGQITTVQDRFSRITDQPIAAPDAKRILEIIKTNGFCVKA